MNRREFLRGLPQVAVAGTVTVAGVGLLGLSANRRESSVGRRWDPPVLRPPGALEEPEFLARCLRCSRCRDACRPGAIRLAGSNDLAVPGTPFISAVDTACTLCLACVTTCPTHALSPVTDKAKVKMGVAVVDARTCVSINGSGVCGACHTACPFRNQAITQGLRNAPTVHPEHCVGCGLCEEACIVKGTKAIRVFSGRNAA